MADNGRKLDPGSLEKIDNDNLYGGAQGLREGRFRETRGGLILGELFQKAPFRYMLRREAVQGFLQVRNAIRRHLGRSQELRAHGCPLRALSSKDTEQFRAIGTIRGTATRSHDTRKRLGEIVQLRHEALGGFRRHAKPERQDEVRLSSGARHRDSLCATVLVDSGFADQAFNRVTIRQRSAQSLQYQGRHAVTASVTVGVFIPHTGSPVGREHLELTLGDKLLGAQRQVGAGYDGGRRLTRAEALDG
ncbi:unnamed protein product [Parascedosporium putredinis]|uniref:Uncharacterized protein n=1 Tax=Parascedosporium putredinis TaxID=1442378 RepID=A0A9P1MC33_9PEZI|nr:unnamed protein product [Parascedosporium putredinis]CAI7996930.1 unnamed protein product [Parascedosporium putredinis]